MDEMHKIYDVLVQIREIERSKEKKVEEIEKTLGFLRREFNVVREIIEEKDKLQKQSEGEKKLIAFLDKGDKL